MARRALMLREGKAPVWERLLTMLFLAALVHGLFIIGVTFNAAAEDKNSAPGLEVLLVSDEVPEADKNPDATYLAQRTQLGSGNTRKHVKPHNRASSVPIPKHEGTPEGDSLAATTNVTEEIAQKLRAMPGVAHTLVTVGGGSDQTVNNASVYVKLVDIDQRQLSQQEFMERTSHVLSLISRNVGVAFATSGPKNALEHVYFSRLGDQKVLAVVVTKSGLVRDRMLRMDLPQADLDAAARFINDNFRGWTLEAARTDLARRLEQERNEYDRLMSSVEQLYKQGVLSGNDTAQVVFVEGASNLVSSEQDRQRLQELLQALEEKQRLVELLNAYLDAKQEAVRVVIGLDEAQPSMRNLVLIGTPARVGNEVMGSLAVLGPTRMDYQHTITSVSYIARLFDRILNESE